MRKHTQSKSDVCYIEMYDGLYYPQDVVENTAPNLWRHLHEHEALEERFEFESPFKKPKSVFSVVLINTEWFFFLLLSWVICFTIFGSVFHTAHQFLRALVGVFGLFGVVIVQ
ncbi:MAG: hypothetical protein ACRC2T_02425, partial [Thermoguttaceae bacterium]